jgi:hypothetical protein
MKFPKLPKFPKKIKYIVLYVIIFLLICAIVGAYYFKGYFIEGATFEQNKAAAEAALKDATEKRADITEKVNMTKGNAQLGNTYIAPVFADMIQIGKDKQISGNAYTDVVKNGNKSEKARALPEISGITTKIAGSEIESGASCDLQSVGWYGPYGPAPLAASVARAAGAPIPTNLSNKVDCSKIK